MTKFLITFNCSSGLLFSSIGQPIEVLKRWPSETPNDEIFGDILFNILAFDIDEDYENLSFAEEYEGYIGNGRMFGEVVCSEEDDDRLKPCLEEWVQKKKEEGFDNFVKLLDKDWRNNRGYSSYAFLDNDMEKLIEIMELTRNPGWK